MIYTYIILTIFFALNFTADKVEEWKVKNNFKAGLTLITLRFILDCIIWPFVMMRIIWIEIRKEVLIHRHFKK